MADPAANRDRRPDRSYGPVVLVGLAGAALSAVAGTREWARATGDAAGLKVHSTVTGSESAPLVSALALLALAAWGVVLVLRGRMRRLVAVVGLLAAAGALVAVVAAFDGVRNDALDELMGNGAADQGNRATFTVWYFVAGAGAVAAALAFLVAVWRSPGWPAMGAKYDAPAARAETPATGEDMWRALDQGHDPTT